MKKLRTISLQDFSYILLFIMLFVVMYMSVQTSNEPNYNSLLEIEVAEGDTLWAIATNYSEDIPFQSYLALLRNYNDLENDRIYPGQRLVVPKLDMEKVVSGEGDYLLSSKY